MLSHRNLSIAETPPGGGQISYELGKPNWEARVIPDIRRPGRATVVDEQRMIDVITLGDRFTGAALLPSGSARLPCPVAASSSRHVSDQLFPALTGGRERT